MRKLYAILLCTLSVLTLRAQFSNLGSSTTVTPNVEYQLTKPNVTNAAGQSGGVWQLTQVNLANPFTLNVQLNFGQFSESNPDVSNPNGLTWATGADGIAFVLAPAPYAGNQGEDIGYATTNQANGSLVDIASFAAEFDTWQNIADRGFTIKGDPVQDHMAFMKRGNSFHPGTANGAGNGVPVILPEIETGAWIPVTITWTPGVGLMVNFNGIIMNASAADVLAALGGDMTVNWGFTGGTALGSNDQRVRFLTNDCSAGRTQTQGGWGSPANGQNPGSYRDAHFGTAFPTGVTVGLNDGNPAHHYAKWTSSSAIQNYLPAGGPSSKLTSNYTNPITTQLKNNAVAQVLALSLSVGFDAADPDFSSSGTALSAMIIGSGPFAGWTVGAFLTEANKVLGGGTSSYTVAQVQGTAGSINENYVDGTIDKGYLLCPNEIQRARMSPAGNATDNAIIESAVTVYPNPSRGQVQVNVGSVRNAEIQIVNSRGVIVERRLAGGAQTLSLDLKKYGVGVYVVKMISGSTVKTSKVLVQN